MSINRGILYRCAKETIPLMDARKPWFCISMADLTPAKCAPAEMPTPSSSFARRTRIISGSSSAMRMRCTSHVSGRADISRTSHFFSASKIALELADDTGIFVFAAEAHGSAGLTSFYPETKTDILVYCGGGCWLLTSNGLRTGQGGALQAIETTVRNDSRATLAG